MVGVVVVVVSVARRCHFSRGVPECWILPYLSTLGVGTLELVASFVGCVYRAALIVSRFGKGSGISRCLAFSGCDLVRRVG